MRHKMMKVGMLAGTLALFAAGAFVYPQNLTTLAARQLYDVREMLAALLLFSVGFAVIAVVILILFLLLTSTATPLSPFSSALLIQNPAAGAKTRRFPTDSSPAAAGATWRRLERIIMCSWLCVHPLRLPIPRPAPPLVG